MNNAPSSPTHPKEKVWAVLSDPRIMPSMNVARAGVLSSITMSRAVRVLISNCGEVAHPPPEMMNTPYQDMGLRERKLSFTRAWQF